MSVPISSKIPCVIFSTMTRPSQDMIDLAVGHDNVPTFVTERTTSSFMAEIIRWLGVQFAPAFPSMEYLWMFTVRGIRLQVRAESVRVRQPWS